MQSLFSSDAVLFAGVLVNKSTRCNLFSPQMLCYLLECLLTKARNAISFLLRCCAVCRSACWQKHTMQSLFSSDVVLFAGVPVYIAHNSLSYLFRCCAICWSACWQKRTMCSPTVQRKLLNSTLSSLQFGPLVDVCKCCFFLVFVFVCFWFGFFSGFWVFFFFWSLGGCL